MYLKVIEIEQISFPQTLLLSLTKVFGFFRVIPNCIMKAKSERRRPFIADQVEECRDASGLFYLLPFQKVSKSLGYHFQHTFIVEV